MANSFIVNGDIRWDKNVVGSNSMQQLEELITTLYEVIDNAEKGVDPGA